jgi:hypothetical protein
VPSKSYATVVRRPWVEMTGLLPVLYKIKEPVPYLFVCLSVCCIL